jgi:four helix bundle protein
MENEKRPFDLEDRLVDFAVAVLTICDLLPDSKGGQNLEFQLSKSGTSAALNYGEAQAAESSDDFIHKIKVVLKELRETRICFKIILKKMLPENELVASALQETNQLIAIFLKSIETAKRNRDIQRKNARSK